MRIVVAPDKFKGCLSAKDVADAIADALEAHAGIVTDRCPVADGGEGFAQALGPRRWDTVEGIQDPLRRPVTARCGWLDEGTEGATAVIEISEASGLRLVSPGERNPWEASTYGTGQLIAHAAARGAARILVGLGGSATNDAGAGAAAALGWQFLTSDGEPVDPRPSNFLAIERIVPPETDQPPVIIAACDVRNPLLGPEGCAAIYARQKGADTRMIDHLETALEHLSGLLFEQIGVDCRNLPGAGAAGGLGYGLAAFCQAELQPGFGIVAEFLKLEERIAASDLVITGEGCMDAQSLNGKAPGEVARLARKYGKPVAAICGQCEAGAGLSEWFDWRIPLQALAPSREDCIRNARSLLGPATERLLAWAQAC